MLWIFPDRRENEGAGDLLFFTDGPEYLGVFILLPFQRSAEEMKASQSHLAFCSFFQRASASTLKYRKHYD